MNVISIKQVGFHRAVCGNKRYVMAWGVIFTAGASRAANPSDLALIDPSGSGFFHAAQGETCAAALARWMSEQHVKLGSSFYATGDDREKVKFDVI